MFFNKASKFFNKNIEHIFILPTIIFIILMVAFPLLYTVRLSFSSWQMGMGESIDFVGLQNYIHFFQNDRFRNAFFFTIRYTLVAVSLQTVLGVAIALLVGKIKFKTNFIRTIFLLPMVATPVVVGILWRLMYEPTIGIFNMALGAFGVDPQPWLGSSSTVFMSLIIMDVWQWTPMIMLIVLAGMSGLSEDVFESARIDGANEAQIIMRVTIPLLLPTILMAVLLRLIDSLRTFDQIFSTTQGGPGFASENLNILTYRYAFEHFQMGEASALLMIFFTLVLSFTLVYTLIKNRIERIYN